MIKRVVSVSLVIIWMLLIFSFSNKTGENSKSKSDIIVNYISEVFKIKEENKENLTFPVRKCAHFFVYFILALLVSICLYTFDVSLKNIIIITSIICFMYACSDEIHQYFIKNRSAKISDVLLDSSASFIGAYIYSLIHRRLYEKNK